MPRITPLPFDLPRLLAHRGASSVAPENTLAALARAARMGAGWVEFDVTLTRDGEPVLFHDDDLDRTTNGHGPIAEAKWADVRKLDAGRWFSRAFKRERVPHFEEALALCLRLGLQPNIEIKPTPGRDKKTARVVCDVVYQMWPATWAPPLLSSFSVKCLKVARDMLPGWPRGYLMSKAPNNWAAIADEIEAATLNINAANETGARIAAYRATRRPVLAYTVNRPSHARMLFSLGVSGVFTDRIAGMRRALGD
jgi:glycerophosphoryl diester phosphodiesterase